MLCPGAAGRERWNGVGTRAIKQKWHRNEEEKSCDRIEEKVVGMVTWWVAAGCRVHV